MQCTSRFSPHPCLKMFKLAFVYFIFVRSCVYLSSTVSSEGNGFHEQYCSNIIRNTRTEEERFVIHNMFSSFIEHACKYVKIKSLLLCLGAIEVRLYSMFKNEMQRNKFSGMHSKLVLSPSKFIVHACKYNMFSIPPSCSIKQAFEYKWISIWNNCLKAVF